MPGLEADADKVKHTGTHHSAFEYASFDDLMSSYKRLEAEGILPAFALDHGLTISIYHRDPEGNYVELQSDDFGDWAQSTHFMRTSPDFQSNPIGTFFDSAKVLEAHRAGQPFATLQPAIRAEQYQPDTIPSIGLPTPETGVPAPLGC